tara:strand:+ start:617 stop:742 length:126 start_codon:yes stop_codon:yes gene_type:complete
MDMETKEVYNYGGSHPVFDSLAEDTREFLTEDMYDGENFTA